MDLEVAFTAELADEVEIPRGGVIRSLVDARKAMQKQRIAFGNRVAAIERGADEVSRDQYEILTAMAERFGAFEEQLSRQIALVGKDDPLIQRICQVKGVGVIFAAQLVSIIDIQRADTVSALWRYSGLAVINGVRERPTKGEKLHYNAELKTLLYLIGKSLIMSHSPYAQIYYHAKETYWQRHDEGRLGWDARTIKGHIDAAARRKMIKVFLSHLWETWREMEGLPVRNLYIHDYGGHTSVYRKEAYGW